MDSNQTLEIYFQETDFNLQKIHEKKTSSEYEGQKNWKLLNKEEMMKDRDC